MIGQRALRHLASPDTNLSPEARVLVLYVSAQDSGDGVEIAFAVLRRLLSVKDDKKLRRVIEEAECAGWVSYDPFTGQGHHPRFSFNPPENAGLSPDKVPENAGLSAPLLLHATNDSPPIVPLHRISEEAERAIEQHAAILTGCRDSLRDYLRKRVRAEDQYSYVQTVAGWVNDLGCNWQTNSGKPLAVEERPRMLAAALNELAATDEAKRKHPVGSPLNLKTTLGILLTPRDAHVRSNRTGTDGRGNPAPPHGAQGAAARPRIPIG